MSDFVTSHSEWYKSLSPEQQKKVDEIQARGGVIQENINIFDGFGLSKVEEALPKIILLDRLVGLWKKIL